MLSTPTWSLLTVFCSTFGAFAALGYLMVRERRIRRRIRELAEWREKSRVGSSRPAMDDPVASETDTPTLLSRAANQLRRQLAGAGFDPATTLSALLATQMILMSLGGTSIWLASTDLPAPLALRLLAVLAGLSIGFLLPVWCLHQLQLIRLKKMRKALPDMLDLLVSCLDAGVTMEVVLKRIADDRIFGHSPLGRELQNVQREIDLGATVDRAFRNLAEKTNLDDFLSLSTVCYQSRKYGASICATLRAHADALRDEREMAAEESAQRATVKILAPTLLCLFPVIFVVVAGPAAIQIQDKLTRSPPISSQPF